MKLRELIELLQEQVKNYGDNLNVQTFTPCDDDDDAYLDIDSVERQLDTLIICTE